MDNTLCKILIPACGSSVRFKDRTALPKGVIEFRWRDRMDFMIGHVMSVFPRDQQAAIICQTEEYQLFNRLPSRFGIFTLPPTAGQADTVFQALRYGYGRVAPHEDFMVINSDNVIERLAESIGFFRVSGKNCGAVVFPEATGSRRYGFIDGAPIFSKGAEKERLSDFALAGAFYFRSRSVFDSAYQKAVVSHRSPRELYISHLFEHVVGGGIAWTIPRAALHEWGSSQQLEEDPEVRVDWKAQNE